MPSHIRTEAHSLQQYVLLRKWSVLFITLLCIGSAVYFSFQLEPVYESEAKVLVRGVGSPTAQAEGTVIPPNLETEQGVAASTSVAEIVKEELDLKASAYALLEDLSVDVETETEILVLKYRHKNAGEARRLTQAFADGYLEFRLQEALAELTNARESLAEEIDLLDDRLTELNEQIDEAESASEREALETQANLLAGLIVQTQVSQVSLAREPLVGSVVQPAIVPRSPVSPNHFRSGALGLLVGLALGVGQALLRGRLDARVHSHEELEALVRSTVLGHIPPVSEWRRNKESPLIDGTTVTPVSEAFRILRTNVLAMASIRGVKSVLVTSARPNEGKTVISSNLALTMAGAGKKVILVSADLKRPRLHRLFEVDDSPGLGELLQHQTPANGLLRRTEDPNLRILPSGRTTERAAELLGSTDMGDILSSLKRRADIVIIDSAPLSSADAVALTPLVDAVLFVVDPATAVRIAVNSARRQLDRLNAHVLGAVFNNSDPEKAEGYSYYTPSMTGPITTQDFEGPLPADPFESPEPARPSDRI